MDIHRYRYNARVAYVYSDQPSYSRAKKTLVVLRDLFREVHFIGARRKRNWDESRPEGIHYHIDERPFGSGLSSLPDVARFIGYVRKQLHRVRPDVIIAVNEEYILPFSAGMLPKPPVLVLDLYDSISLRILGPAGKLRPVWQGLSSLAMLTTDALVEVDESRLRRHPYKPDAVTIIYNSPPSTGEPDPLPGLPAKRFLYVGGTMEDHLHGLETLHKALERAPEIEVIATGKPVGEWVQRIFLKHPRVHYLGLVPYEDVQRIAAASLGVFSHYSPMRLNYVYGAPNKLYEAMQAGVPVLINRENHSHRMPQQIGFGVVSPFGDVQALADDLHRLLDPDESLIAGCSRARQVFEQEFAWDRMATERYKALFDNLNVPRQHG